MRLRPLQLLEAHRLQGAGIDAGVVGHEQHANARDDADAGDDATARHRLVGIVAVEQPAGHRRELEKGHAGIEQARHALARQQLAAPGEERTGARARLSGACFEPAPALDERERVVAALGAIAVIRIERQLQCRHQRPFSTAGVVAR